MIISTSHLLLLSYNQGIRQEENCQQCPFTTQLLEQIDDLMTECVFGNAFFSIISPGTHITPHCGPTNVRLRTHVPIFTPADCVLNVAGETTTWEGGRPFVFDDSFAYVPAPLSLSLSPSRYPRNTLPRPY
eukprot:TRINITY_DN835_c0_g1_i19.p1 TRINITY_DN835_c0_g1~~TRINITY_DN835_c0_g1_i19.p1  ORF type:complete len:131 (+),score=8.32 TRINITY_DN835_c0_g1_i19:68-460(+)